MSDRRRGDGTEKAPLALPNFSDFAAPDFIKLTSSVVSTWSQVNSQLISFAQSSLQHNIEAAEELRQVQSPKELIEVQLRIARRTYEGCLDEATKIGQIVQQLSADTVELLTAPKNV